MIYTREEARAWEEHDAIRERVTLVLSRLGVQDHGGDPLAALEAWADEEHARCLAATDERNAIAADRDAALAHAAELEAALREARAGLDNAVATVVELRAELATERAARVRAEAEVDGRGRDLVAVARERDALRAERDETLRRVRVVLDHFGVADCDDPIAALEEVPEIADAVVDDEVAHANELTLQIAALRAIVEGRTTPPTDAECEAVIAAGGWWRWLAFEDGRPLPDVRGPLFDPYSVPRSALADVTRREGRTYSERWWCLDAQRRPCAWPVVTEAPRA